MGEAQTNQTQHNHHALPPTIENKKMTCCTLSFHRPIPKATPLSLPLHSVNTEATPLSIYLFVYLFIFVFLGPYLRHMEGPRLGVEWSCSCHSCATATAVLDPSRTCNLHHSSLQRGILNPSKQGQGWNLCPLGCSQIRFR